MKKEMKFEWMDIRWKNILTGVGICAVVTMALTGAFAGLVSSQVLEEGFMAYAALGIVMLSSFMGAGIAGGRGRVVNQFAVGINCGASWGMICLSLDILKGYIPIILALHHLDAGNPMFAIVMAAPVLGHAVSPFHHFHGGKCISTAFGEMLALYTVNRIGILLALIYILLSTIIRINPNRLRSMVAFGLFGTLSAVILTYRNQYSIAVGCVLISLIALIKHTIFLNDK